jgi:hypothetical protein
MRVGRKKSIRSSNPELRHLVRRLESSIIGFAILALLFALLLFHLYLTGIL